MIQPLILAAGQGTRMRSHLPKVLHLLAGKPLLEHVISAALSISPDAAPVIICGHQSDLLRQIFSQHNVRWVEQQEQLGTGHAVMQALPELDSDARVLVLYGDVPLISPQTLKRLIEVTPKEAIGMLTAVLPHPKGYGRIKRDKAGRVVGIVEEKDTSIEEKAINEINPGIYLLPVSYLQAWLPELSNKNAQGEYYLTDIIARAVKEKIQIHDVQPERHEEIEGINNRIQLAHLERFYQREYAEKLMEEGVTIYDPARLDIRGELIAGKDVILDVNVIIEGRVVIGSGCKIGPNVVLRNVHLGEQVEVRANSVIEDARIASHCIIGPFARIRPGTELAEHVHVGNFVEVKNSRIADNSKVNHLSYIGDAEVGKHVNVGAGTITCNYDGANKHKTTIGDNVHIGSDTQLVAPVTIGAGATIAAGSTIVRDVEPAGLTLSHRIDQRSLKAWKRPEKVKKEEC